MIEILDAFKIGVEEVDVHIGCSTTLYQIRPRLGVKVSKIRNLKDEIAIALDVENARVIPGKGAICIEAPNEERQILPVEDILSSDEYRDTDMALPCAIGETVTGKLLMADLAEMPHLLIAGATGQGKSVGLNTILMSLMSKRTPNEMTLVLIDPKQVEFGVYSPLEKSYLATPVITDANTAQSMLRIIVAEMETRYTMLSQSGVRNIKEYNAKVSADERMQYIVVVIDEYGDLIMQAGKDMERLICRIAQKARAVGIHMILSTQRPSVSIVTGDIKANFPVRIAFRTTTSTDSRVVLGKKGAEALTGMGDMILFNNVGTVRAQCAYTSTEFVEKKVGEITNEYADWERKTLYAITALEEQERKKKEYDEKTRRFREAVVREFPKATFYCVEPITPTMRKACDIMCTLETIEIDDIVKNVGCELKEALRISWQMNCLFLTEPSLTFGGDIVKWHDRESLAEKLDRLEKAIE